MNPVQRVLIVGGGIAGQTLACALARRAIGCEIVEVRPDWQITGAGMTFQGTALRALLDVDLTREVIAAGWQGGAHPVVFTDTLGETIFEPDLLNMVGADYPPQIAIRRQPLHDILLRAVTRAGVPIRMGTSVASLTQHEDRVDVLFTDGSQGRYDLVVGADGIHSVVRALVFGDVKPQFAGFANWRAILPRPASIERMVWMWGHGRSIGVLPVDGNQIFVAGVTKEKDATRYPQADLTRLFREKFRSFGGVLPDVLAVADAAPWLYTVMEEVKLEPPWYKGRVLVLGDAAHAACPFWAQGAAMAIEDAIALAQSLGDPPAQSIGTQPRGSAGTLEQALHRWMARRQARCAYVQDGSHETGVFTHLDPESEQPKHFPASARAAIAAQFHARELKMSEPF